MQWVSLGYSIYDYIPYSIIYIRTSIYACPKVKLVCPTVCSVSVCVCVCVCICAFEDGHADVFQMSTKKTATFATWGVKCSQHPREESTTETATAGFNGPRGMTTTGRSVFKAWTSDFLFFGRPWRCHCNLVPADRESTSIIFDDITNKYHFKTI